MRSKRWLPAVAMVAALAVCGAGCDQRVQEAGKVSETPEVVTAPPSSLPSAPVQTASDSVTATAPETKPVEPPEPVLSYLMIDGLGAQFPATKMLLHEGEGGQIRAELFSDLPKSALAHYEGNALYLEMDLDGAAAAAGKVDGASWRFKSTSSDKAESGNGIFLNGERQHLQPSDVLIKFERQGDQLMAVVMGQFRAYQSGTPDALAPFVGVRGAVPVEVVEKR